MGKKSSKTTAQTIHEAALNAAKEWKVKKKAVRKIHQKVEARRIKRVERQSMVGTAVMDSGTTSTIYNPKTTNMSLILKYPQTKSSL